MLEENKTQLNAHSDNSNAASTGDEMARLRARIAELESELVEARQLATGSVATRGGETIGIDQLRAVFENYAGGMCFSRDGIIIDANRGLARMLGVAVDELIGRPIVELIAPEDRDLVRDRISRGDPRPYEHRLLRSDGTTSPVEASASMVSAAGAPLRFSVVRDISDRRRTQESLDRERRLFQAILDHMPAGVFVVEVPSGRPVLVNRYSRRQLRKAEIADVPKEQLAIEYQIYLAGTNQLYPIDRMPIVRAMSGEVSSVDDMELRFPDGDSVLVEVIGAPIYDGSGKISMSVAITEDITHRKRTEEKLRSEQDFLRGLIKTHERDRQMMSYEIHDGLVQYITAAVWHLESVAESRKLPTESRKTVLMTLDLLRKSISDARRVLSGLRPPVLDEQGILVALDYLAAESSMPDQLEIIVKREVQFRRLEPLLEGAIYRIVQESLNNVRKHSQATQASVQLAQRGDRIELHIDDNGCGFTVDKVPSDRFGLQGIRKRAELLGGSAHIESKPGSGTRVFVDLPLLPYQGEHHSEAGQQSDVDHLPAS